MDATATFNDEALAGVMREVERLKSELTFAQARALPEAQAKDVVMGGREVQLTIFRQTEPQFLKGDVLVTVQVARFGLGGIVSYHIERGIIFSARSDPRDATERELLESGG